MRVDPDTEGEGKEGKGRRKVGGKEARMDGRKDRLPVAFGVLQKISWPLVQPLRAF